MTSVTWVVRLSEPLVPVIVIANVPSAVDEVVLTVSVEDVPVVVVGLGLNDAVAPLGSPLAANDTAPANPPVRVIVTVYVVVAPRVIVWLAGDALSVKFDADAAVTTSVALAVCDNAPLVPVIVSG
jgi:hypothetical protein